MARSTASFLSSSTDLLSGTRSSRVPSLWRTGHPGTVPTTLPRRQPAVNWAASPNSGPGRREMRSMGRHGTRSARRHRTGRGGDTAMDGRVSWADAGDPVGSGGMRRDYGPDVLAADAGRRHRPEFPRVPAERGLVVEESGGGFCGAVVDCEKHVVTLEDRLGK